MTKETLLKMMGGLSEDERKATLNELAITDATLVAECMAYQTQAAAVPVTQPAIQQPVQQQVAAPVQQAAALPMGNTVTDTAMQALQQQLAEEQQKRIMAECGSFFAAHANKVTPAELTEAKKTYMALAALPDQTALNSYTASVQARPVNSMMREQVAAGNLQVLGNGVTDTRTEEEKEAALVQNILAMTPTGRESVAALQNGQVPVKGLTGADGKQAMANVNLPATLKQFALAEGDYTTK